MAIKDDLINFSEEEFGESYKIQCLEIYKIYVEMTDRISSRRHSANSFFLSINTALIAFFGYIQVKNSNESNYKFFCLLSIAGIAICFLWYRIVRSYRNLNTEKFKVIHEIEKLLPLSPYNAEWTEIGKGKNPKLYLPFTHIEMFIPWVFLFLYLIIFIYIFH